MQKMHLVALFSGLVLCLSFVAGCGGGTSQPPPTPTSPASDATPVRTPAPVGTLSPRSGGTLRVATTSDNLSIDPALLTTNPDVFLTSQVYDKLMERAYDMTVQPELATTWEASADLSVYTVHLRSGAKFHSGKAFTASDAVYSLKRVLDPATGSPAAAALSSVKDVVAVDGSTLRFELALPSAFFPDSLTTYQLEMISATTDVKTLVTAADGTGPFSLKEFKPGERAILERNQSYWGQGPYVDQVVFYFMPSNQGRIEALKTGSVDVAYPLAATAVPDLQKASGVRVSSVPSGTYITLVMDQTQKPFDNIKVRQAVQAATDRQSINKAAMLGLATVGADIQIAPNDPNYPANVAPVPYDPARAKQLLVEAGYPNGIDITLHASDVYNGLVEMAVAFQASAAPAGIRVKISRDPADTFWDKVWLTDSFVTVSWSGRDADSALSIVGLSDAPWNESKFKSPEVDALIFKARGMTDVAARRQVYGQLQKVLADDASRIIPVFVPVFMGLRANVQGLEAHPGNFLLLEGAWLG